MFRNQYDSDVTVWSPLGRLHQVEYAMEAVKLGSATVGVKNKTHAVLVALKRASSELSAHQKKIIVISQHVGVSISGLTADARLLSRYMRTECLNHEYTREGNLPVSWLINRLSNKMQSSNQRYDRRPYGVGMLVAGYDEDGPHIYQICPSANAMSCRAMAIGSRSQSARTYIEKSLVSIVNCSTEELVKHALRALRDTLPNDQDLNGKNVAIAIVGKDQPFKELNEEETIAQLDLIAGEERRTGSSGSGSGPGGVPPSSEAQAPDPPQDGDDHPDPSPVVAMES